jgi:hypothetical protein
MKNFSALSLQLRAGESFADAESIGNSNPINKQSRYAILTSQGKRQILKQVAPALESTIGQSPAWIWSSINSCSYQTAEILTSALSLGQHRLIPEYSFLDPRGLGALDGQPMSEVMPVLREGDASSPLWRPPRGVLHPRKPVQCNKLRFSYAFVQLVGELLPPAHLASCCCKGLLTPASLLECARRVAVLCDL